MNIDAKENLSQNTSEEKQLWSGFTPGMQGWFTVWKPNNVICHIHRIKKKKKEVVSIDAEREFENTQHLPL